MTRICPKCKVEKPLTEFHRDRYRPNGRSLRCRPCNIERSAAWVKANPDRVMNARLLRTHNLTLQGHEMWTKAQGQKCLICELVLPLRVDHCHTENRWRGLLCSQCNVGLGNFYDSPGLLRAAADYIERDRQDHALHKEFS